MDYNSIKFYPLGDEAILINFEQRIDPEVNNFIHQFTNYLKSRRIESLRFFIPAYSSLTIGFDKDKWNFQDLRERLNRFLDKEFILIDSVSTRMLKIPVCYDKVYGPDLDEVASEKGMTRTEFVRLHTREEYQVYMLGFLPGFVYLGKLPEALHVQRRPEPRLRVPACSVGLAGSQTGIYPSEAPGGWHIIGRTPVPIFLPGNENPFLFNPGDRVRFYKIAESEFEHISEHSDPWSFLKTDPVAS